MKRLVVSGINYRKNEGQDLVYLGSWCTIFDVNTHADLSKNHYIPYHWNDRIKLENDYKYLNKLYEILLEECSIRLNYLHGKSFPKKYWRIIIGVWLGYFIQMVFDRWSNISAAIEKYKELSVVLLNDDFDCIPNDMEHFNNIYESDFWNEIIYRDLIKFTDITIINENINVNFKKVIKNNRISKFINFICYLFGSNDKYFFITSFLPRAFYYLLSIKLKQVPKVWRKYEIPIFEKELDFRNWGVNSKFKFENFESLIRYMLPRHMPKAYLEGYKLLNQAVDKCHWPKNPDVIFTSNSYSADDFFKMWSAKKTLHGSKLIIGQHGGYYGLSRWSFSEDHQLSIATKFISWGWKGEDVKKIIPFGNFKILNKKLKADNNGSIVIVQCAWPRHSYHLYSCPISSQWEEYFNFQCRMIETLPYDIMEKIIIRLYPHDYDWKQRDRWLSKFPYLKIDDGTKPLYKIIKNSSLIISTYNSTTYLETIGLNVPTMTYWNENFFEIRDDAIGDMELLKAAGIFHSNPESASNFLIQNHKNIRSWWKLQKTQAIREYFYRKYTNIPEKPIQNFERIIKY